MHLKPLKKRLTWAEQRRRNARRIRRQTEEPIRKLRQNARLAVLGGTV